MASLKSHSHNPTWKIYVPFSSLLCQCDLPAQRPFPCLITFLQSQERKEILSVLCKGVGLESFFHCLQCSAVKYLNTCRQLYLFTEDDYQFSNIFPAPCLFFQHIAICSNQQVSKPKTKACLKVCLCWQKFSTALLMIKPRLPWFAIRHHQPRLSLNNKKPELPVIPRKTLNLKLPLEAQLSLFIPFLLHCLLSKQTSFHFSLFFFLLILKLDIYRLGFFFPLLNFLQGEKKRQT